MDQPKCLDIWVKTKNNIMKRYTQQSSYSSSPWKDYQEGESFGNGPTTAAHGSQGGPMWPPRSYSCTFCKREFKSAQALGGHMNVHRRDRALLKEVITTHIDDHHHQQQQQHDHDHVHHVINPSKSKLPQHSPSKVCNPRMTSVTLGHHLSLSRVSPNCNKKVISNTNDAFFQANNNLSMGLDLAIGRYPKEEIESFKCKRFKKINGDYDVNNALFPFFEEIKSSNYVKDGEIRVMDNLSLKAYKSMEELDLELRLGDPPHKVT